MPAIQVPAAMPGVTGIFVGGCVKRGDGSSFRAIAHAHNAPTDAHFGWICVRSPKRLWSPSKGEGHPSRHLMHEYVHILTPGHGHDATFRAKARELGLPLSRKYGEQGKYQRGPWKGHLKRSWNRGAMRSYARSCASTTRCV